MNLRLDEFIDTNILSEQTLVEQDSGFKAWEADSVLVENNTNLLRNLNIQLNAYSEKYRKSDTNKTLPIKLPSLEDMKSKNKLRNKKIQPSSQRPISQNPLTQRKPQIQEKNENIIRKHKSIQIKNKYSKQKHYTKSSHKLRNSKSRQQASTVDNQLQEKNQQLFIPKVQEMKFMVENQKRIRKRDLYLAIFGERGKGKVQKIEFDEQNKAYQVYLQRRNQQMKINKIPPSKEQQKNKLRSCSQINSRYFINKKNQHLSQAIHHLGKCNISHMPMR